MIRGEKEGQKVIENGVVSLDGRKGVRCIGEPQRRGERERERESAVLIPSWLGESKGTSVSFYY